jgi:hypothetical protein
MFPKKAPELEFKGKRHMGWPRTRWFKKILEDINTVPYS